MGFSNLLHQRKAKPQPVKRFEARKDEQPLLHTCMPTRKCRCWWHIIIYVDKSLGRQPVTPRLLSSPVGGRGTHTVCADPEKSSSFLTSWTASSILGVGNLRRCFCCFSQPKSPLHIPLHGTDLSPCAISARVKTWTMKDKELISHYTLNFCSWKLMRQFMGL